LSIQAAVDRDRRGARDAHGGSRFAVRAVSTRREHREPFVGGGPKLRILPWFMHEAQIAGVLTRCLGAVSVDAVAPTPRDRCHRGTATRATVIAMTLRSFPKTMGRSAGPSCVEIDMADPPEPPEPTLAPDSSTPSYDRDQRDPVALAAMRVAYHQQATTALMDAATLHAERRAKWLRRNFHIHVDEGYAEDLVYDALRDTLAGDLRWEPAKRTLLQHITNVVEWRSRDHGLQVVRRPGHDSIQELAASRSISGVIPTLFASHGEIPIAVYRELLAQTVAGYRRIVGRHRAAIAILDAWHAGYMEKPAVIAFTGLSDSAFRAGCERLRYLVDDLPQSLHDAAKQLLRSAS
jgi:hypothetical protein